MSWKMALIIGKLKLEDSIWLKNGVGDWLDKKKNIDIWDTMRDLTTKINFIHLASKFSWFLAIQEAYKFCIVVLDFKWNDICYFLGWNQMTKAIEERNVIIFFFFFNLDRVSYVILIIF